ncbi:MAG: phosphate acyltransferase [Candidatus Woesearchaeota archaeon]
MNKTNKKDELMQNILAKAKTKAAEKKPTLVLCEGWDERGLKAAENTVKEGVANIILLDLGGKVQLTCNEFGIGLSQFEILDIKDKNNNKLKRELAELLFKAREKKGMTMEKALQLIEDENYFGCCMVLAGKADAVVGSLIRPTGDLMKPALQLLKRGLVNEVMVIYEPKHDRIFFATDASLNISPTPEQLAEMAVNTADIANMFGYEPKVGILSFSTKGSGGDTPETMHAREAVKKAKELRPNLKIGGEYQFDAAVNPEAAKRKCPEDEKAGLAGHINCLIFPNLTASNIFTHGMMQVSDLKFLFTLMQGTIKPISILGRSTPQETVTNMFIVAAVEAVEMMK